MTYSIGDVEELTGIKANVLRYWETVIPGFAPKKDIGGRRVYTERDYSLVIRLKTLIYERKFTIEGARNELLHEADRISNDKPGKSELLKIVRDARNELSQLYLMVRKYRP